MVHTKQTGTDRANTRTRLTWDIPWEKFNDVKKETISARENPTEAFSLHSLQKPNEMHSHNKLNLGSPPIP